MPRMRKNMLALSLLLWVVIGAGWCLWKVVAWLYG